ncbi:MAG: hypothetical protein CW349_04635 [Firmicutes bacterium]|nr:hypothetical protein [Bacillota bacterium]MBO2518973.1 hypothetical protein [Bacillota bacterium]
MYHKACETVNGAAAPSRPGSAFSSQSHPVFPCLPLPTLRTLVYHGGEPSSALLAVCRSLPDRRRGRKAVTALEHAWGGQVDWTLLGGQASLGLLLGYAVGYTTKKALKVGLILVALLLVMGIALEELGFLVINWGVLEETYRGSVEQMGGLGGMLRQWSERLAAYLPVGAGFSVGFLLGLRNG